MLSKSFIFLFFCVLVSIVFCEEIAEEEEKPKVVKKVRNIDFNKVEKDWESGDDEEELEHEFERIRKIQQSKMPRVDMNDGAAIQKAYKADPFAFSGGGGGSMIFVDLYKTKKDGSPWTKYDLDKLSGRWASLIRTGALAATVYNVGENSLMVNVERAWMTKEVLRFVALQPDVESFNANSKTYTKEEFIQEDEDDDL